MNRYLITLLLLLATGPIAASTLEKAETLRSNGLLEEAKLELVELFFADETSPEVKAEVLLMLGEIALEEQKPTAAKENWTKLVDQYPDLPPAETARAKLEVLEQLSLGSADAHQLELESKYAPGTRLVVGPSKFPWAAVQIAGVIGQDAQVLDGSLTDAIEVASQDANVSGLVEVGLEVDVSFESGRVVCHRSTGEKVWEKKVMFNIGGGEERIARRFIKSLSAKIQGLSCP